MNQNKDFFIFIRYYTITVLSIIALSSCKLFREVSKSDKQVSSDSTHVTSNLIDKSSIDTSKTKRNETSTKETVYYPQPIYIQGKDGETKTIFVPQSIKETGSKSEEINNAIFENYKQHIQDSLRISELERQQIKQTETKGSVLSLGELIGLALIGLVIIGMAVMVIYLKNHMTSIRQLLQK